MNSGVAVGRPAITGWRMAGVILAVRLCLAGDSRSRIPRAGEAYPGGGNHLAEGGEERRITYMIGIPLVITSPEWSGSERWPPRAVHDQHRAS